RTGEVRGLRPEQPEGQPAFRFHWNSPLIGSAHNNDVLYLGGNCVFKLWDKGRKWKRISDDLTTQNLQKMVAVGSGAESYGVIYTLAESPLKSGMLWTGTDDGKLWVTENDGETWSDLTSNLPKNVKGEWLSRIEASRFDVNVAYLAVDAHRNGNYAPLAFRTSDKGKTWQNISSNLPNDGPVKVLREDVKNPNILFAGTEFALLVSTNRGERWVKFGGLPTVAIDDIQIHPREKDLVVATHGRSLYIVDDISPLEDFVDSVKNKEAYLFSIRSTFGRFLLPGFADWNGTAVFRGANPPSGAIINYYVKDFTGESVSFTVADSAGKTVANLSGTNTPGFNRIVWDLKWTNDLLNSYGGEGQKFVRSGEYTVTMSYGKLTQKQKVKVEIADGIETK
ncbi:MAG: hypothetical protein KGZ58_06180, partial [Ignavibacteriales bacterium]|nr:hypothetical protein [Ignavibacteriales bacterium]